MISNLIRKALGPTLDNRFSGESIRLNAILNEMETALDDVKSIRASDIADSISTYDIAQDISIDAYDIAKNIEIDPDDIEVDTRDLAERIAREIGGDIDIDYSELAREISEVLLIGLNGINDRINNVHTNLQTVERKMDLLLNHNGIGAEDLLVYSNSNKENA
jgi:translation elongation factor EF-1beta